MKVDSRSNQISKRESKMIHGLPQLLSSIFALLIGTQKKPKITAWHSGLQKRTRHTTPSESVKSPELSIAEDELQFKSLCQSVRHASLTSTVPTCNEACRTRRIGRHAEAVKKAEFGDL